MTLIIDIRTFLAAQNRACAICPTRSWLQFSRQRLWVFCKSNYLCSTYLFCGFKCAPCAHVQLRVRACTHHFFFHSYMCDTLFLCKTTFVNMFMTSKLILEHFWLHTGRMRTRPTRSIKRGGGSQSQFEDGDFRFSANFIIRTQVTYSGSYLCMYQVSFREMIQR